MSQKSLFVSTTHRLFSKKKDIRHLYDTCGAIKGAWNFQINRLKTEYEEEGKSHFRFSTKAPQKGICSTYKSSKEELPYLKDYPSKIVRTSLQPIETQYLKFFSSLKKKEVKEGLPKFKGKRFKKTMTIALDGRELVIDSRFLFPDAKTNRKNIKLRLTSFDQVKRFSNPVPKTAVIKEKRTGKWYIIITWKVDGIENPRRTKLLGIDRNINKKKAFIGSNGTTYRLTDEELEKIAGIEKRIIWHQKRQSKRKGSKKGQQKSCEWLKCQKKIQNLHGKIAEIKDNRIKHIVKSIADGYDFVALGKLDIKSMTASAKGTIANPGKNVKQKASINRAVLFNKWYFFEQRLKLKGVEIIHVDHRGAAKKCSQCGHIHEDNLSAQNKFKCLSCGYVADADFNAALNIKALGEASVRKENGYGGIVRPLEASA